MALFADYDDYEPPARRKRFSRGWLLLSLALILGLVLGAVPAPYVVQFPGPVFNTLGTAEHNGEQVALITIPSQQTYPTAGSLDLLTVSSLGNPDNLPTWFQVVRAWFDPSKAVLPVDEVYRDSETQEQRNAVNQELMVNSQQDAVAAALTSLDIEYSATLSIRYVSPGAPADGILEDGDIVTSINGEDVADLTELRGAIAANGTEKAARVGIVRDGDPVTVEVTPVANLDAILLGIGVGTDYTFPFDVDIGLDNVGGPSAGMMFALGIIDKLTPGELNGGQGVAGTGTIDAHGRVGGIGGIQQKLYGAQQAGTEWFLAPQSNCDEVQGHIPDGLTVFAVETLDDSLAALEAIESGAGTGGLPTCAAND